MYCWSCSGFRATARHARSPPVPGAEGRRGWVRARHWCLPRSQLYSPFLAFGGRSPTLSRCAGNGSCLLVPSLIDTPGRSSRRTGARSRPRTRSGTGYQLHVRFLASGKVIDLPGTDDAHLPFWSPDSRQIAFGQKEMVRRVNIETGAVDGICEGQCAGGSWGKAGTILLGTYGGRLRTVPATGGQAKEVQVGELPARAIRSTPNFCRTAANSCFCSVSAAPTHPRTYTWHPPAPLRPNSWCMAVVIRRTLHRGSSRPKRFEPRGPYFRCSL